jgi:hypothetical protein
MKRDTVLTQQVFISGKIRDALSGLPPLSVPSLQLVYRDEPTRPYALAARLTADGLFAFYGNPVIAFPKPVAGQTLNLRLVVKAEGYAAWSNDLTFTDTQLLLANVTRTVGGENVTVKLRTNLSIEQEVSLHPNPLTLAGRVVDAAEPNSPISSARVLVSSPTLRGPIITQADGFFTLPNLPVALNINVQVTRTGYKNLVTTLLLDYSQPINQVQLGLVKQ